MSTKEDGYVGRINCKCYKELSQSLRVRVYISFKFVAECSRLKSKFKHISVGWSLKKRKCGLIYYYTFSLFFLFYILKNFPLTGAARNGHTNIVRLLIENGADVNKGRWVRWKDKLYML